MEGDIDRRRNDPPPEAISFDELMSQAGVRPLGAAPPASPRPKQAPPQRPQARTSAPAASTPPPAQSPAASPPGGARGATVTARDQVKADVWAEVERMQRLLDEARSQTAQERARADQSEAALAEARKVLVEAAAAVTRTRAEAAARAEATEAASAARDAATRLAAQLQASRDEAVARLEDERRRVDQLQAAVAEARSGAPLSELLAARGLVGADEPALLLRGLAEQRQVSELIPMLHVERAGPALELLYDRVSLWCGQPDCPVPPGRAVLRVAPARCDVCGGGDLRRAVRRFLDAALVHGVRRVTLIGGAPSQHRQLRALLTDPRVQLTLLPPRRSPAQAREDLAECDLLGLWSVLALPEELIASVAGPRVALVSARPLAAVLEALTSFIEASRAQQG